MSNYHGHPVTPAAHYGRPFTLNAYATARYLALIDAGLDPKDAAALVRRSVRL